MNICITGALGHIGSKLIRNLKVPSSSRVYLIDSFLTQRYASLFDLPNGPKFVFSQMDILSPEMENIVEQSDLIIHLAAITDAETSFYKKDLVEGVNKKGLKYIADLCVKYKKAIIFPSTTSVYGSQSDLVDENCDELRPQSPYAESKLFGEKLLDILGKDKKLRYVILRLGTIFGYSIGMRFHTAVNKFIFQAVNNQEITVWKTAYEQKRPYCDLDDAIGAINHIIKKTLFNNEIYNIVTINSTVKDILNIIRKYIPGIKIKFVESPIMNQLSYEVSNMKSLKKGFTYNGDVTKSIKETIEKLKNVNYLVIKKKLGDRNGSGLRR